MSQFFENIKQLVTGQEEVPISDSAPPTQPKVSKQSNRFDSFAPPRSNGRAKYFIDGADYFHAVSVGIENAQTDIWIMDWWLSPELYLRRPPSENEEYRLDRLLKAAADRGVKVNVMVYKEVPAVLTTCSEHTKHALEALHPTNIACFRHPDHNPSAKAMASGFISTLKDMGEALTTKGLAQVPAEGFEALYSLSDDVVLYWAHHEKLCLIDGRTVYMGGLDMCYGRWDTHQHEIADAHPEDINNTLWPGQDFNNSRIMDFQDVANFERNKLDRRQDARMGWSDLSMCLEGPVVEDFRAHFVARWNWIYEQKYASSDGERYQALSMDSAGPQSLGYEEDGDNLKPDEEVPMSEDAERVVKDNTGFFDNLTDRVRHGFGHVSHMHRTGHTAGGINLQMVRSASRWSHGIETEHSIQNAYIEIIRNSEHFIYIENQFFITSTSTKDDTVKNQIGAALVERIVRAHSTNQNFRVIVVMPSIPAFAGDLHSDDSAGTMAIMQFQYRSICRGPDSILSKLKEAGIADPSQYIEFFNLRNYDRINAGGAMAAAEAESGIDYETARKEHDDTLGAGYDGEGEGTAARDGYEPQSYNAYQSATTTSSNTIDSVAACYMHTGPPLQSIPWTPGNIEEIDAFVSEELYIHTKLLIADDRTIIIGSANLNDRSQNGDHDSEMAVVIQDTHMIDSTMNGEPYRVSKFATQLRRQLFRKHLGMIPPQDPRDLGVNGQPLSAGPNAYDWDSEADMLVADPLSPTFTQTWKSQATTNTSIFARVFAPVPSNAIRNWDEYQSLYGRLFVSESPPGTDEREVLPARYKYGHVVRENFEGGVEEVKEVLGGVRGTLVDMPLDFLCEVEELAKRGVSYNEITEAIYT